MLKTPPSSPGEEGGLAPSASTDQEPPPSSIGMPPTRLVARGDVLEPLVFKQGAHPPFGIRWYGITSLFGHLRNFAARAIAAESVDARDWMRPNPPSRLATSAARVILNEAEPASEDGTLLEAIGRPLWIDFVADTGDDRDVSAAVGTMLATTYEVDDGKGGKVVLPRGDVLIFGGDIAYPVATADEIYKRLILPWNESLRRTHASSRKRVILGVPGNHDWYDGLDGFGRLFRRRMDEPFRADDRDTTTRLSKKLQTRAGRNVGLVARQLHLDEVGGLYGLLVGFVRSVRAFFKGVAIRRRRRLVLRGYEPIQEASYFALPLAPGLDLFGADRQLGRVDFRQRSFFSRVRANNPDRAVLFVAGDPAMAYGMRNDPGARMLAACRLSLDRDRILYLAGDFHHYERRRVGRSTHVIAGGGGAFLHGTRLLPYPKTTEAPAAVYPSTAATRRLAAQVPLKLTLGRAGLLVHLAMALVASIELGASGQGTNTLFATSLGLAAALWICLYFVAHQGIRKRFILLIAAPFGLGLGLLPLALRLSVAKLPAMAGDPAVIVASAFGGAFLFGLYLTVLCVLGLEHQQAFTVLGHPGFKHFVRLRVQANKIEAWTIGKDDMLAEGAPVLIDEFDFEWDNAPE